MSGDDADFFGTKFIYIHNTRANRILVNLQNKATLTGESVDSGTAVPGTC